MKEKLHKKITWRLGSVYFSVLLTMTGLILRLGYVQVVEGQKFRTFTNNVQFTKIPVLPPRGFIYSSDGTILAEDKPIFSIYLTRLPHESKNYQKLSQKLAPILKISQKKLLDTMKQNPSFPQVRLLADANRAQISYVYEHHSGLPGVYVQSESERDYPYGDLAGHVLGYVGPITAQTENYYVNQEHDLPTSIVGETGIEASYESYLQGKPGYEVDQINSLGYPTKQLGLEPAPVSGDNVQLTLNSALQARAQQIVANYVQNSVMKSTIINASAVLLNVKTGGVLAMVSYPYYNPNWFISGSGWVKHQTYLQKSEALLNNVIQSPGYPGSTVKPANGIAGLESGAITPQFQIFDRGFLKIGNRIFHNWYLPGFGWVNVQHAIELSDDTFFYHLGLILGDWHHNQYPPGMSYNQWVKTDFVRGIDTLFGWEYKFGLGALTGIDLPGEVPGEFYIEDTQKNYQEVPYNLQQSLASLKSKGYYNNYGAVPDLAFAAIGQSQMFTPIELAQYVATIANNGVKLQPHLLKAIYPSTDPPTDKQAKPIKTFQPVVQARLAIKPLYLHTVQKGMYEMANNPQGLLYQGGFANSPYHAAGKTGTAQIYINGQKADNSVTIAYAPFKHPQVAIAVMVPGGGASTTTASHIAHRILNAYFEMHHEYFPKSQWLPDTMPANWKSSLAYKQPEEGILP